MREYIQDQVDTLLLQTAVRHSLPTVALGMGISSWDGANMAPPQTWPTGAVVDNQEQVDWWEALLPVMAPYDWFDGGFAWSMQLSDPPWRPEVTPLAADLRGQPAEQAINLWYGR